MAGKSAIVDQMPEALEANFTLADVGVTIDARAEFSFRIIEMEGDNLVKADECFDLGHDLVPAFWRANVVAGGIKVGRIKATTEPLRMGGAIINLRQVLHSVAEIYDGASH